MGCSLSTQGGGKKARRSKPRKPQATACAGDDAAAADRDFLNGQVDEEANKQEFQKALQAWRSGSVDVAEPEAATPAAENPPAEA